MKNILSYLQNLSGLAILSLLLVSCVKDETVACHYRIRLRYDYNMDYVDKFLTQAQKLNLLIFDEQQLLYKSLELEGEPLLSSRDIDLALPTVDQGKEFTFLAWVGLDSSYFEPLQLQIGQTHLADIEVGLQKSQWPRTAQNFQALMHGSLTTALAPNGTYELPLVKNTNKFRLAFRISPAVQAQTALASTDYDIQLVSTNGRYDNNNQLISDEALTYTPYFTADDERGFIVELNTLRLVDGRLNQLRINSTRDGSTLLLLDLNEYLEDLRFLAHQGMKRQEFFDRQDEFAILFLLGDQGFFGSFEVKINGWLIREASYTNK